MLELSIESMLFGIYNCPVNWIVQEKGTAYHRLYYVYDGEAFYSDNHTSFPLEKYHLYLFPVNRTYNITHNPKKPFKCMFFHIATCPMILNPAVNVDTGKSPAIYHMTKTLEHILNKTDSYPDHNELLPQLLICMISLFDAEVALRFSDDKKLQMVLDHIHRYSSSRLTNEELASIAGYDRCYFARLFRKTFNVSPQKYIENYRFTKAGNLLLNKFSVKQVAELVGFQDEKAFSRAFKKVKGCPPSVYLKSHSLQP